MACQPNLVCESDPISIQAKKLYRLQLVQVDLDLQNQTRFFRKWWPPTEKISLNIFFLFLT